MKSVILQTAARLLEPVLLLFSIFLLFRGHNEPGGGFIGGLVASTALILHSIAYQASAARQIFPITPRKLIGVGILLAASSGILSVFFDKPFMTGIWWGVLGTPVLFDIGVYLVVVGVTLTIVLALAEEK